ncbi:MAG: DUF4886 domain-containing protein [Bacteroidaceae bacterium]|nr:DUF4886 domain-containing protein [Bacteroidaceae bacterium]
MNNNYGVGITGDANVITADETQLHNGELCWLLNGDQTQIAFGQTLKDAESVPVVATAGNRVFKVTYIVEGSEYEVAYTNGKIVLPKTDPAKGTDTFTGWYDAVNDGKQYTADSTIDKDITLYAHFYNKESDGKIRILAIGNSFTVDAVEDYLAPIIHSTGQDVIIGYPYKGGTTLEQHMGYINTNNAIYNYRKIEAGKDTYVSKGTTIMKTAIVDEPWDYVIIQTDHNYSGVYSHYFPYLTDLMTYVKSNISNPTAKFILYMTWAYDEGSSYSAFSLYNNDQMTMYNAIVDCAYRAAEAAGIETVIPTGTAIQNCRSTYIGQNMNRDGYHLNYTYGRYVAGLSWAKSVLGIDPETVTYHPATISDNMAKLCQQAVNIAFKTPKTPTSMAEEWGVDPDIKNAPLARPVFVSFDSKKGQECAGTYWNVLQSADATGQIEKMVDNKFVKTGVKVAVVEPMTAGYVDGPTVTETEFDMPAAVSSTAFIGTGNAKMSVTGLRAGQAYDFGVFGSYSAADVNMETRYVFTGVSSDSVALDVANNTQKTAWVKNIVADSQGRVTLTIKAGDNNTDNKKTVAINALEINPHLSAPGDVPVYINLTNTANVAADNWNNITENALNAGVENMINAYKKSTGFGVKITKAFAGVNESGATSTTADFAMPAEASKTAYWVNGVKKDEVLVDEAELEINGLDPTKMYNFCFFASQTDNTEVYEAEYTAIGENNRFITLNANGNTSNTSWINDIQPTQDGKIRITITPGPSSIDTYKVGYLNTIMMTYADTIQIDPEEGIPSRPEIPEVWDGKTVVEPLQGANDWYIITNGAELAWISQIASKATFAGNVVFTKDIDLGNHKWTPIGNATQYYNGCIEGNGHTVKGLYLEPAKGDLCSGLVGATNSTGYIRNLNLEGKILFVGSPTGSNQDVGSFVGLANALSLLENCHSTMDIDGTNGIGLYTGGLLGRAKAVNVNQCSYSGNMIAGKNNSKGGWGGLVGTFNSSVVDAKGGITNSWFDGTITCSSTGAFVYGSALCGYANLSKGMCTIKNNYINGSVAITGVTPTNYNVVCGKAVATTTVADIYGVNITSTNVTTVTETQLHNGELSRKLNYGVPVGAFGQDMSNPTSHPVVFADSIVVLKTDYVISAGDTTVVYNNHSLIFPEEPVVEGYKFLGWFDAAEGGNQYKDGDSTDTDLTAYAHFEQVTGIEEIKSQSTVNGQQSTAVYNLQGVKVKNFKKGDVYILNGKKYIKK